MDKTTFNREQLYELVWANPLLTLSKKYNISDIGLRKVCNSMDVPLPKAGYWAKVKHGQTPPVKSLPPNHYGQKEVTLHLRDEHHPSVAEGLTPAVAMQQAIELEHGADLIVKAGLNDPDPLIVKARPALIKRTKYYKEDDLLKTEPGQLDIRVSDMQINRALCLMDAFIKIMRKRGHDFKFRNENTYIVIGKEDIPMTLREATNTVVPEEQWGTRRFKPNGILILRFGYHEPSVTGKDGKVPIEQQLSKIVARLELMAEELRVKSEDHAIWLEAYREQERLKQLTAERKKLEIESFQKAIKDANRWQQADTLRNFIDQVEKKALAAKIPNEETTAWVEWARKKADWLDPLIENDDEWLKEIERDAVMKNEIPRPNPYGFDNHIENAVVKKAQWPLVPWYVKNKG